LAMYWVQEYGILGMLAASCVASFLQCMIVGIALGHQDFLRLRIVVKALFLVGGAALVVLLVGMRVHNPSLAALTAGIMATVVAWGVIWFAMAWFGELRSSLAHLTRFAAGAVET